MPKYHWLPLHVWRLCGSRCLSRVFVDEGALMIVASLIVPRATLTPWDSRCRWTAWKSVLPRWCFSRRWRNLKMVVSSGTGSRPRSMPTKRRMAWESYKASPAPRIREVEPLLEQGDARHALETHGRPAVLALGIVGCNDGAEVLPGYHFLPVVPEIARDGWLAVGLEGAGGSGHLAHAFYPSDTRAIGASRLGYGG